MLISISLYSFVKIVSTHIFSVFTQQHNFFIYILYIIAIIRTLFKSMLKCTSFSQSIVQYCSLKSTIKVYCSILTRAVLRTVSVAQLLHLNVMTAQIQQDRDAFRKKHELLEREAYRDTHISHTVQAKRVCPNTSVGL